MDNKNNKTKSYDEQFDLEKLFAEMNKEKFLIHFEYFIKYSDEWYCSTNGQRPLCINEIVTKITDNLLNNVCLSNFKYEKLLFQIQWQKYLFNTGDNDNAEESLKPSIFVHFIAEYVQIFPNRCEKFLDDFLFILRGQSTDNNNETMIVNEKEMELFLCLKQSFQSLISNVKNFEFILVRLMKKHYPFIHNSSVHEFICFAFNMIQFVELFSFDNAIDLMDFLFIKLLEIDMEQFFNEFANQNKENSNVFEIELESFSIVDNDNNNERFKKLKILDSILSILFNQIDDHLKCQHEQQQQQQQQQNENENNHWDKLIQILTRIFFQRILSSNSIHCQYLIFYICSQSESYCDILVNDLWTLLSTTQTPIRIRQSSINIIISLFLNGRFINTNSIFSLLKLILQSLNSYLLHSNHHHHSATTSMKSNMNENDLIYYQLCIGFCQLFCIFHNDFNRNQIDYLKNMDMKRTILISDYKPLQYVSLELGEHFIHLCNYYRIGYANISDIQHRTLNQTFSSHQSKTCYFGSCYLKTVKNRIQLHVNDLDKLFDGTNENFGYQIRNESLFKKNDSSNYRQQKTMMMMMGKSPNFTTTATTTTTSDDGMTTSPNEGGINNAVMSSFIMNHMLSDDCETME